MKVQKDRRIGKEKIIWSDPALTFEMAKRQYEAFRILYSLPLVFKTVKWDCSVWCWYCGNRDCGSWGNDCGREISTAGELALKRLLCWKELLTHQERRQADAAWGEAGSEQGLLMKSGQGHWMQEKPLHTQGVLSSEWAQQRSGMRHCETGLGKKHQDSGTEQMGKEKCRCQWIPGYRSSWQGRNWFRKEKGKAFKRGNKWLLSVMSNMNKLNNLKHF